MLTKPEKRTIEQRLLDPSLTPVKKAKKRQIRPKTKQTKKTLKETAKKTNTEMKSNKDKNDHKYTVKTRRRLNL